MKIGDIVKITDASWSIFYGGDGCLRNRRDVKDLSARRWKVLATELSGPADHSYSEPDRPNDVMLCEVNHLKNILFTQSFYCIPEIPPEPTRVTVREGTKELIVTFK